jgi:DNA-directed RNA polymerase specialized sigma24 family protein
LTDRDGIGFGKDETVTNATERLSFDRLLEVLGGDPERAGDKYEAIRRKLIKFLEWRGCLHPEEVADETIDRVARRVGQGEQIQSADPARYFMGVARNVLRETWARERRERLAPRLPAAEPFYDPFRDDARAEVESRLACIERCLELFPSASRRLLTAYYAGSRSVDARKALARELGIGMNALWIRMHRLRSRLEACARTCTERGKA